MAALPIEILYGLYLGALIGVVPILVAWVLGFGFKYVTGVSIPGLGVVVLAVAIAGANGGLLALNDPALTASGSQVRLTVALVVVLMGSLWAHGVGDRLGASLPRRLTLRQMAERTLSADVIERVGGRGRVRVTVAGEVGDIEGYPPLPADLRAAIRDGSCINGDVCSTRPPMTGRTRTWSPYASRKRICTGSAAQHHVLNGSVK